MKITLAPDVALTLETIVTESRRHEFSGFGFTDIRPGGDLYVYDFKLLHVGSEGLTIIQPEQIIELMERPDANNMRLWTHRHPLGNGIPGWHNWSGTDNATIAENPLGGIPELVKWSASIVRTLGGWVGRIDNHITKKTVHVEVYPRVQPEIFSQTQHLLGEYLASLERPKTNQLLRKASRVYSDPVGVSQDWGWFDDLFYRDPNGDDEYALPEDDWLDDDDDYPPLVWEAR